MHLLFSLRSARICSQALNACGRTGELAASLLESLSICADILLLFCLNAIPSAVLKKTKQAVNTEDPLSWLDTEMIVSMTFRDEFQKEEKEGFKNK